MSGFPEKGTRVRCIAMPGDPDPVAPGTLGTVTGHYDGSGTLLGSQVWVRWDDGRTLSLLPGVDEWEEVDEGGDASDDEVEARGRG